MYTPEVLSRIAHLQQKALADTITKEEMGEAVALIREGRVAAASRTDAAKRTKARQAIPSADELMDQLMGGES